MSRRQGQLAERRAELIARSAQLRDRVSGQGANLRASFQGVDRGISMLRAATARPLLLAGAFAALVVLKPGRAFKWIARAALVTSLVRRAVRALDQGHGPVHSDDLGGGAGKDLATAKYGQPPERFGA